MKQFFLDLYKNIFNIQSKFKCLVFLDQDNNNNKLVDAFEISATTHKKAYKTAYYIMKLKYPDMRLDIRIHKNR